MKSIAFYNAKAGVGCTSLVYHLAFMYAALDYRVVVVDADPQCDLSGLFLGFDVVPWLEDLEDVQHGATIGDAILHGCQGGDAFITAIAPGFGLVLGDLRQEEMIAEFTRAHELCFSGARSSVPDDDLSSTRMRRLVHAVGTAHDADLVLIDVSPGLGVCSCLAVTAADAVVVPVSPDETAVRGLQESVRAVNAWRTRWDVFAGRLLEPDAVRARREADARGYAGAGEPPERIDEDDASWLRPSPVIVGHVVTGDAHYAGLTVRPQLAAAHLAETIASFTSDAGDELAALTRWVILRDMWLQHRKPMFALTPADGAIGSTAVAVQRCRKEFAALARALAEKVGVQPR